MQEYFFTERDPIMNGHIIFENKVAVLEASSIAGKKESEGNLKGMFDFEDETNLFGKKTWEDAESEMQRLAYNTLLSKLNMNSSDFDFVLSGDLQNQCTAGSYSFANVNTSYIGIYGACSTFSLGLALASSLLNVKKHSRAAVLTSSHYCSAERQFRTPLEYGSQRTPTAQWTVTGASAVALSTNPSDENKTVFITDAYFGSVIDKGISDPNNMGAAMAPAAASSLINYFKETNTSPKDYDLVLTGDLGTEGSKLLRELMSLENIKDFEKYHDDCGMMIYDIEKQDVHSGGSGCACSACTFSAKIFKLLRTGVYKNILLAATGALMNPQFLMQGKTIPSVAHVVHFVGENN